MGTFIRSLSERVDLITSDDIWMEGNAIDQLLAIAKLPGIDKVVGMPDLHAGNGYPIGAAFFSVNRLYPALIGGDIGCGMGFWQTDIKTAKLHLDKFQKRLGSIDAPLERQEILDHLPEQLAAHVDWRFLASLGTIGLGNHFAEFQQVDEVYLPLLANEAGLDQKCLQLLVHSGSRGFGGQVGRAHIDLFSHNGMNEDMAECLEYLHQQQLALDFARLNRQLIAIRMLRNVRAEGVKMLDLFHNYIERAKLGDTNGWLHRKGAASACHGLAIIPGSRGDYSFLVQVYADEKSLFSLAHGAGRKWIRGDCKGRLKNRFSSAELLRSRFYSRFICDNKELVYEEAPYAYKSVETVVDVLAQAGVIDVVARLKPVLTYKTLKEDNI